MYGPPACGIIAATSPRHNAPVMVINPASSQTTINHPGDPTSRDDSADTMKMPLPIIEPTTIVMLSTRVNPRTSEEPSSAAARSVLFVSTRALSLLAKRSFGSFVQDYHAFSVQAVVP